MAKIKQELLRRGHKLFDFLIEDVRVYSYLLFFIIAIMAFGLSYYILTPIGHGIGQNAVSLSKITIPQGLYFSIVSVSSLGYGDMHPMGASKILACLEVLMGLALMGIIIAKVTSRRLSYHVLRLFSSDAQKRLEGIAAGFETLRDELITVMPQLSTAYQSTPGAVPDLDKEKLISRFNEIIGDLHIRCIAVSDYFSFETQQGSYFSVAPVNAVMRVGEIIDGAFLVLSQLIISLSPQARLETLHGRNRQKIAKAIESQICVCGMVCRYANDSDTLLVFQRIEDTCKGLPASYFAIPEEIQPDQVLGGTDNPQEQLGEDNE